MTQPWSDLDESEREFLSAHGEAVEAAHKRHAGCPDLSLLVAAKGESLPPELHDRVLAHLGQCALCRMLSNDLEAIELPGLSLEQRAQIRARIEQVGNVPARPKVSFSPWTWLLRPIPLAAAAVALLVVGSVLVLQRAPERPQTRVSAPAPAPQTLNAAMLPLEKPPIQIEPSDELVWRGGSPQSDSYQTQLKAALDLYKKDDFAAAARNLERLDRSYPQKAEVKFYDGISKLFLEDYPAAIRQLEAAKRLAKPPREYEAAWYLAVAEQRAGQSDRAMSELQNLCRTNSQYAMPACEATKTMFRH